MVLEDYTLKHVWGPKTQQVHPFEGSRQDSDPDQGSRRNLHNSLRTLDFGVFAFLPFSLGPAGDCPCRH